jgi:hypothetical protein
MSTQEQVLLSMAFSFLATGVAVLSRARNYLRPDDHRPRSLAIYFQPDRLTSEGRRHLVRSWTIILVGIGLAVAWALA